MTILNLTKWQKVFQMGEKTQWKKDKLLVTSNLSFFHCVFQRLALQTRKNQGLFGKGLSRHRQCYMPYMTALAQKVHDERTFTCFLLYLCKICDPTIKDQFSYMGHNLKYFHRWPLDDATCHIRKLYPVRFETRRFLKISFFISL